MNRFMLTIALFLFATAIAHAIQTPRVEFGLEGDYDGAVSIELDAEGNMLFEDVQNATTPLSDLLTRTLEALSNVADTAPQNGQWLVLDSALQLRKP